MKGDMSLVLTGQKLDLLEQAIPLGEYLFNSLKSQPMDKLFQVILDRNEKMTFRELYEMSGQICAGVMKNGLQQGDFVSLIAANSNALHATLLGIMWAGGVPHPLDKDLKKYEMQSILGQVKPKWIFVEETALNMVMECLKSLKYSPKVIVLSETTNPPQNVTKLKDVMSEVDMNRFEPRKGVNLDDLCLILCSSGTTGIPKAVALSHRSVLSNILLWRTMEGIDITQPNLATSEFSWITGAYFLMLSCMYGTFRVVTTSWNPVILLKAIQDYKLYSAMIPPALIKFILDSPEFTKYDVSSMREVYTGGSLLGKPTLDKFRTLWRGANLIQAYGLTEMGGLVTIPSSEVDSLSVGTVVYNTEIKIVDPDTREILGPNQQGEICIRSNNLFITYIGNEEAAKKCIEDGWFCSGDIGHYSDNKLLYIDSRIKEIFKFQNKQISPSEMESYISTLDGVVDVGIAGVVAGEDSFHLMALVVKNPNSTITSQYIIDKVAENFSESKHLRAGVYFIDQLPRSVAGKLKRKELSDMANKFYM